MLDADTFLKVVDATPLVAVDLVLVRGGCEVLLGLRNNRPAQGFWFVPGGRILKNEGIQTALTRVAHKELGLTLSALPAAPRLLGAYEHFYADCFAGSEHALGVSTHYVVLGHVIELPPAFELSAQDDQHSDLRWWPLDEALNSSAVHRFTRDYLPAVSLSNR